VLLVCVAHHHDSDPLSCHGPLPWS
jgi:hypothetical protein